jgi:hypothetical protein
LRDGVVTVGRSNQCECPLHDESVSRRHFELTVSGDGVHLRDLGSGNGTKLNGQPVEEARLQHGDRILAGNSVVEFRETEVGNATSPGPGARARRRRRPLPRALPSVRFALVGFAVVAVSAVAAARLWQARKARLAMATAAYDRACAELAHDPPDPDLALSDLLAAQIDYPDHRALQDALAEVRTIAAGVQQLARARELASQRDFDGALRQLSGLPETPYFARARESLAADFLERQVAVPTEAPHQPAPVIRTLPAVEKRATRAGARHPVDDDRADELSDEADALLGRDAARAKEKYREALRFARPGGAAARRAQAGLEN